MRLRGWRPHETPAGNSATKSRLAELGRSPRPSPSSLRVPPFGLRSRDLSVCFSHISDEIRRVLECLLLLHRRGNVSDSISRALVGNRDSC